MARPPAQRLRVGIDVGGTFTDVVAVDAATRALVARVKVPTTHDAPGGVAEGIVAGIERLLERTGVDANAVAFIAHSTTQATNALLEGDLAPVGILGLLDGLSWPAARQMHFAPMTLASGVSFAPAFEFASAQDDAGVRAGIDRLIAGGTQALAASRSFGVDRPERESYAVAYARERGIDATSGHDVSSAYGLRSRTRTAALNAAILPKMLRTARMTAGAVARAAIPAPLMVMRSDDGGQSSTVARSPTKRGEFLRADEQGRPTKSARGRARPSARRSACRACRCVRTRGSGAGCEFAAIVAGVSGYEGRVYGRDPTSRAALCAAARCARRARRGARRRAGRDRNRRSSSVVYARAAGVTQERTLGGWGRRSWAMRKRFRHRARGAGRRDARARRRPMRNRIGSGLCVLRGAHVAQGLARAIYAGEIARDGLASFAGRLGLSPLSRNRAAPAAPTGSPHTPFGRPPNRCVPQLCCSAASLPAAVFARARRPRLMPDARIVDPRPTRSGCAAPGVLPEIGAAIPELSE